MDDFRKLPPPSLPKPGENVLGLVRLDGKLAGRTGRPPSPPREYAVYAEEWHKGWQVGARERGVTHGWLTLDIDYSRKQE